MPSKKKMTLRYQEDFDLLLFGISTSEKDYRFIWLLNESMGTSFTKTNNHSLKTNKPELVQEFSSFVFFDEVRSYHYRIIANKSENGVLIEELRNIDYFMLVSGEMDEEFPNKLRLDLSKIENVQAVFLIELDRLKSKERLITS